MTETRLVEAIEALMERQGGEAGPAIPVFKATQFRWRRRLIVFYSIIYRCGYGQPVDRAGSTALPQEVFKRRSPRLRDSTKFGRCFQQFESEIWPDTLRGLSSVSRTEEGKPDYSTGARHRGRTPCGGGLPRHGPKVEKGDDSGDLRLHPEQPASAKEVVGCGDTHTGGGCPGRG